MSSPFLGTYNQIPVDDKELMKKELINTISKISVAVNAREIAGYELNDVPTGQRWFKISTSSQIRNGRRKVLVFNSILNGVTTIAHGIQPSYVTDLYGSATDGTNFIPIPYVSTTGDFIQMTMDGTNVYLTTTMATWTGYSGTVVVEYL